MSDVDDTDMRDGDAIEEERMMYGHGAMTEQDLDEKYPSRPHNHSKTLPFHDLYLTLFDPLLANKKKPMGLAMQPKRGPDGRSKNPNEMRRTIIERFIDRWKKEVGNDIFPAFRLIVPEKDKDRAMYGLKESTLGKLLVRVMKIDKNSEDGHNLIHWKLPGVKASSAMAGDFGGRCFEVINKRPMRSTPGDMTIAEVNELLDRLSVATKEENQRPIIEHFYERMCAEELMWLIRMILRQMKIGATEKTLLNIWHPDAEQLFNISSSLRRVCWDMYDPEVRLNEGDRGIALMQCFQPQLAAFQMRSMDIMVSKMGQTEKDLAFWVEDKLDGERMQLHMIEDDDVPGGRRFAFWSRKAKDYTYLYGSHLEDETGSLTRFLGSAFHDGVRNIILDGEMMTWDPKEDAPVAFGHLKTAAINERDNPYAGGNRPFFVVFDCLYANDKDLTRYTLRDRRKALDHFVNDVHRRFEKHKYTEATVAADIEPRLRDVIANRGEGLVLKNPRSAYRLNVRSDDWIKVKPEYMTEFGEDLDCLVIGGYYGSGHRGGRLSSFMCGLRVDEVQVRQGASEKKFYSFFKVGGGFTAADYAEMRHRTDGKWKEWDRKRPPSHLIELGGGERQFEQPDVWINPEDSVIVSVKAASIHTTEQFRVGVTLRFPRFKSIRTDKDWSSALTISEFMSLKARANKEREEKKFQVDEARRKRTAKKRKRDLVIQGQERDGDVRYAGPTTKVFEDLSVYVMSEAAKPIRKSKAELEELVRANGGSVVASEKDQDTIVVSDKKVVKAASIIKRNDRSIIRPSWLLDCVEQSKIDADRPAIPVPFECPRHFLYLAQEDEAKFDDNADNPGKDLFESHFVDTNVEELEHLLAAMPPNTSADNEQDVDLLVQELLHTDNGSNELSGWIFYGLTFYLEGVSAKASRLSEFAGATVVSATDAPNVTHVVVGKEAGDLSRLRKSAARRKRPPRLVSEMWVLESWRARTRLDEERKIGDCLACIDAG